MVFRVDLLEDAVDAALLVDYECRAGHAHIFASVHRLLDPDAVCFAYCVVGVGQQREVQFVLVAEVAVRAFAVGTDAYDAVAPAGEFGLAVAQTLCFECAARSVVLGVKIEYRTRSFQVGKR